MTAEVAVMNRKAVALAADSAMSIGHPGKTYPVNKLFALSKRHPIGVMIYHNAEFMGVPWETLVKMHRQAIKPIGKATVGEYANSFLDFIKSDTICTEQAKAVNVVRIAHGLFGRIARKVKDQAVDGAEQQGASVVDIIQEHTDTLESAGVLPCMEEFDAEGLVSAHEAELDETIRSCFRGLRIGPTERQALHNCLAAAIKSARLSGGSSGLVFAGFGEEEIFPSLVEIVTDGVFGDVVKAYTKKHVDIDRAGIGAAVISFAQSEMVGRFMNGIDPEFMAYLRQFFEDSLVKVVSELLGTDSQADQLSEQELPQRLEIVRGNLADFEEATNAFRWQRYNEPILDIVNLLPKEELAGMAEALVSLTSLKRRVSTEEESVGGPVDVAVISKGDGFVWIKRKHYFDPSLNRDYLARQSLT